MKILLVHNFYQSSSPSGEDVVFKNEIELLKKNHIEAITYEKHNDDIARTSKLKIAFITIWSRKTYRELKNLLIKEKPDIAHFHNIWYLISPSAYYACKDYGIPVVQTLHNFRFFCANGLLMRNGRVCEECIGRLPWRSLVHGCYRNSRLYSIPVFLSECFHRFAGIWKDKIDAFIALTEFGKNKFIECGLSEEKIFVKPNFLSNPLSPSFSNNGYAVFIGRLSVEKGLKALIEAFKSRMPQNLSLKIIGDSPQRNEFEDKVNTERIKNIEFTGRKNFNDCIDLLKRAIFLVMPSTCYEGFPMVIIESFACGKPVIASNLGAMAELVEDGKTGLLFEHRNPDDLANKMKWMIENEDACIEMGRNARKVFEEKYTSEKNFEILMDIYMKVIARS